MSENRQANLWSKNFIVVSSINFLMMVAYYMLLVTIGSYVVDFFQASKSTAGLIAGIMVIGCLIGRFITGYLIELIGCRKVLFIGLVLFIVFSALYFTAFNLAILVVVRLIHGFAVGVVGTVTGTIVFFVIPKHRRGEGISYFSMSTILAAAMGPFLGILLMQYVPFNSLIVLCLVAGVFSLVIAFSLSVFGMVDSSKPIETKSLFRLSNYIEPKAVNISFVMLVVSFGYAAIQTYLSFYASEINLMSAASFFFVVYAIVVLISRPFTGRLLDLKGENIIIYPALVILTLGFIIFSQASSSWSLLLSAALIGLGFGNFQSVVQTVAVKISPINKIGQANSTFFILLDFGIGLGPYFLGFLIPYFGYRGLYLFAAFLTLISIGLYYLLHARHHHHVEIIDENNEITQ